MSQNENHLNEILKDPELKEIWDLAGKYQLSEVKNNDESWENFQRKVEQNKPKLKVSYSRLMAYAAAIGLFILSSVIIYNFNSYNNSHPLVAKNISTGSGQLKKITLPDGSVVTLNGNSTVSYELKEKSRTIQLTGMAHFEVAPNKEAPFSVVTQKGTVTVLGTGFDVSAYSAGKLQVIVNHGKVKVENQNKDHNAILTKGMMVESDGNVLNVNSNYSSHLDWMGDYLIFHDASLNEVITALEAKYGTKISVESNSDLDKKFTGKFKQNQTLESVSQVLEVALNIKLSKEK